MNKQYKKFRERVDNELSEKYEDKEEVQEEQPSQFTLDMDNLPKQEHIWVDRGAKMSCEGAAHPNHQVWKKNRR